MEHKKCATASVPLDSVETDESRFLTLLPLELRRIIYGHCLYTPLKIWESQYRLVEADQYCNIYCLTKCQIQLLAVNHQVHDEARDVLYSNTMWHFSFNSFMNKSLTPVEPYWNVSQACLQSFRSRLEFQFIRHVTIGVMFLTVSRTSPSYRASEDSNRLTINQKLLKNIGETLHQAPSLRTLKVLWHDRIHLGDWEIKRDCLRGLESLPDKVNCTVFLGRHLVQPLSVQEQEWQTNLNRYLATVRQQYQACSQREPPER